MIENPTLEQLSKLTGIIYLITNLINNEKYVGKTKVTFRKRYRACRWWKNPSNLHLKYAAKKYGIENFKISILEYNINDLNKLNSLEIFYIKELNTLHPNGYNYFPGGEGIVHTEETRRKASERQAGNFVFYDHILNKNIYIHNLCKFCKDNNLSNTMMTNVSTGKYKRHKQYTLPGGKLKRWKLLSPNNKEYTILEGEMRKFCRDNKLNKAGFYYIIKKKATQTNGWRLLEFIDSN